jgi:uncharacterized surface protein with fasciclin (FAS1) repeats
MKTFRSLLTFTAITIAFTGSIAAATCGQSCESTYPVTATAPPVREDLVAVAQQAGQFKTLVAAVQAAGLVETLQGKGPFTIFAPTDAAFGKLPAGTVEGLLQPENRAKLTAILTYHVLPGQVLAADVKTMSAKTVNGQDLAIKAGANGVTVNGANVVKTDVMASNGVIHVVDSVILPK